MNDCIKCGKNDWKLVFPDPKKRVKALCSCGFIRDLTHTEINIHCGVWG